MSEDIDLAIDRAVFGYEGMLSKGEIRKLRRASHDFSLNKMPGILHGQLEAYGIDPGLYEIEVPNTKVSDQDPEIILLDYKSVFEDEGYLPNRAQIEIDRHKPPVQVNYPNRWSSKKRFLWQTSLV